QPPSAAPPGRQRRLGVHSRRLLEYATNGRCLGVCDRPEAVGDSESCCDGGDQCQATIGADNLAPARPQYHFGSVAVP
ncbi:MAG: hypothetical protein QOH91_2600, partial [Mycobacterium sp.]|nr:hypothetical protein [Mycobacterium sp.]